MTLAAFAIRLAIALAIVLFVGIALIASAADFGSERA